MAEEHRCETPEGHRLCANNCGFFGSSATMNFCSKCYRDIHLKEQEQAKTKSTIETALSSASSSSTAAAAAVVVASPVMEIESLPQSQPQPPVQSIVTNAAEASIRSVQPNRCGTCRKRTGLTGFKCRCGITFCGTHRYPEKHECGFDFKAVGREEIAKANPVIKADKLRRI
ncbi:zinc finger A20 and AN1 domain-containing stress-associated protein 4 [Vicia villosa]|uniref:zinc finger A20 and AN1 domain-containing stress-associated protein 4 n=1 Tax=Vicia villosa TaxID=3911 RepID=UPI00273B1BB5|nr:zinc finger A20 and AN1 domain-containing stress-associated protein 4 [Vicia villosa]